MKNFTSYLVITLFAWRNIWRYPKRTIILLSIIFLGFFCTLFFSSLMQTWGQSMLNQTLNNLGGEVFVSNQNCQSKNTDNCPESPIKQGFTVNPNTLDELQNLAVYSAQRIVLPAIIKSEYEIAPTQLVGVNLHDELTLSMIGRYFVKQQNLDLNGRHYSGFNSPFSTSELTSIHQKHTANSANKMTALQQQKVPYEVIVGEALLQQLNTQVGRRIVLMTEDENGQLQEIGLRIIASFSMGSNEQEKAKIYLPIKTVQQWLSWPKKVNQIAIKQQNLEQSFLPISQQISAQNLQPLLLRIQQIFPQQKLQTWQQKQPMTIDTIQMMLAFNWVWVLLIGVLMLFGLMNSLYMILYERRPEFITLFTLGMSQTKLRMLLLMEIFGLLFLANFIAIIAMNLFVLSQKNGIDLSEFSAGNAWLGVERILYFHVDYAHWFYTSAQLFIGLLIASFIAVWIATGVTKLHPSADFRSHNGVP